MGYGIRWITGAGLAAALAIPAIVAYWQVQSSLTSATGASAPRPPDSLAFDWHAAPRPLADLRFLDAEGGEVALADFRGRLVLVNLWATWCAPCLREMPALDALQGRLGGPDFTVVAISQDRAGLTKAGPFWDKAGLENLSLFIDKDLAAGRQINAAGLPTTLLVDRRGREVARLEGPAEWDAPEVVAYLAALSRDRAGGQSTP